MQIYLSENELLSVIFVLNKTKIGRHERRPILAKNELLTKPLLPLWVALAPDVRASFQGQRFSLHSHGIYFHNR